MKTYILFYSFLCCMTTLATFAQEKKAYTLEDVIPGRKTNYFNLVPEKHSGTAMVGRCMCTCGCGKHPQHSVERWQGKHTCHTGRGKSSH